jgi:hypothetical protein
MSALGEVERVDFALHADTGYERAETYKFAKEWTLWLVEHGIEVKTVHRRETRGIESQMQKHLACMIPAFSSHFYRHKPGQLQRLCTPDWKIQPMNKVMKGKAELWLGISTDEALRMKPNKLQRITNRWPLIEMDMSRNDCVTWLKAHELEVPTKSSCYFCPYHDSRAWRDIMAGEDREKTIAIDHAIRQVRAHKNVELYIHPSRKPIEKVNFDRYTLQMNLWDEECEGICGV